MFWGSVLLALMAATLALIAVGQLIRAITKPVDALKHGAQAIAGGDLSFRVSRSFDEEFDEIAAAFNAMAERLSGQITDREQARRELEYQVAQRTAELTEANEALKKSDDVRRNFLADISHELRTPLTIIRGEAQVALRRESREPAEYRDALACVLEQSVSLSHLVDDLLFVARADSNSLRIERQTLELASLFSDLDRDLRALAKEKGVALAIEPPKELSVVADRARIRQLLVILVENAVRYSSEGTTTKLRARRRDKQVEILVEDQGHGIDEADLPFIFERFYRGEPESDHNHGMGLGLTVARAIVSAHGGQIHASSKVGCGTTMLVTLPVDTRS